MANTKMTYKDFYNEVIAIAGERTDLVEFATNAIAVLDKRNEARKGKTTETSNEFQSKILEIMTDPTHTYTAREIATACEITTQKATGVLGQMVKSGKVEIADYSPTGKKKDTVKGYTLITVEG